VDVVAYIKPRCWGAHAILLKFYFIIKELFFTRLKVSFPKFIKVLHVRNRFPTDVYIYLKQIKSLTLKTANHLLQVQTENNCYNLTHKL